MDGRTNLKTRLLISLFLLVIFILSSCARNFARRRVRLYSGPKLPLNQVALLIIGSAVVQITVDGIDVIAPPRRSFSPAYWIEMLPGVHRIAWEWNWSSINFSGEGTLDAKAGRIYAPMFYILPGNYSSRDAYCEFEVKDVATWIQDNDTKEVMTGHKPSWHAKGCLILVMDDYDSNFWRCWDKRYRH